MGLNQSYFQTPMSDSGINIRSIKIASMYIVVSPERDSVSSSSESTPENTCVICLENKPDHVITTCWHKCLCYKCGSELKSCPICRTDYDYKLELKKVFES